MKDMVIKIIKDFLLPNYLLPNYLLQLVWSIY
jgi:hypothetical protein